MSRFSLKTQGVHRHGRASAGLLELETRFSPSKGATQVLDEEKVKKLLPSAVDLPEAINAQNLFDKVWKCISELHSK